jgi:hypothetical protein
VQAFIRRHPELRTARLGAIQWEKEDLTIYDKVVDWFSMISKELSNAQILAENTYNMDETGTMLSKLNSIKAVIHKNDTRGYRGTGLKRTTITAIECVSGDGRALGPLIIWPACTHRSNWITHDTPGWHYAHSPKGYTDTEISFYWIQHVFHPLTKDRAGKRPRLLINDGFGTHESIEVLKFCEDHNIIICRLPSHTSHKLQPCDVGVFSSLKTAYREEVEKLYRGGAGTIGKEHFTLLYDRARRKAFTRRNILKGYSEAGLIPLNPHKVIDKMQKPVASELGTIVPLSITTNNMPAAQPPKTPITSEALTALCRTIQRNAAVAGFTDSDMQTNIKKLTNAAEKAFADGLIMLGENEELFEQNCEKATRAFTKATVVGTARVMKFEELREEQRLREQKEVDKEVVKETKMVRALKLSIHS